MKKIAFIGTHGVRKTTYAHALFTKLKEGRVNVGILEEVARMCPLINEDRTSESQKWIFYRQMVEEFGREFAKDSPDVLICDRGVVDNYAYHVHPFGRDNLMDEVLRVHAQTYDLIIRVPMIYDEIDYDGLRSTDKEFQETIDNNILDLLKEFKIPYEDFKSVEEIAVRYISISDEFLPF